MVLVVVTVVPGLSVLLLASPDLHRRGAQCGLLTSGSLDWRVLSVWSVTGLNKKSSRVDTSVQGPEAGGSL